MHIWPRFGRRELGQAGVLQSKLDVETNSTAELGVLTITQFEKYHLGMIGLDLAFMGSIDCESLISLIFFHIIVLFVLICSKGLLVQKQVINLDSEPSRF